MFFATHDRSDCVCNPSKRLDFRQGSFFFLRKKRQCWLISGKNCLLILLNNFQFFRVPKFTSKLHRFLGDTALVKIFHRIVSLGHYGFKIKIVMPLEFDAWNWTTMTESQFLIKSTQNWTLIERFSII